MKNLLFAIQPLFLPWIGFYDMIDKSNTFVLLDDVQFNTRSWQQRNKIKSVKGQEWITVPVKKKNLRYQKINEVEIDDTDKFIKVFEKKIISNYSRSTYFKEYKDELFDLVYSSKNHKLLINLNIDLLKWTMEKLRIKKRLVLSSTLKIKSENKVDRIIKICQKLNSQIYLCNEGAVEYLNESKQHINLNKIEIYNHNYDHPNYGQLFGEFIKYISSIDLLFNEGPNSYDIIKSGSKNLTKII